jgi:glycine/D-amino acid oxidase-like deaminating enzyme
MKETEVLIVGQGLAGTWLSWWFFKTGIPFKLIDLPDPDSASRRAAGVINPVTGRRIVTTWMIEQLLPFASASYGEIGRFLETFFYEETSVIDFFPSVQMMQAFQKRYGEDPAWLVPGGDPEKYSKWFSYELGWGSIQPCLLVYVEKLLTAWRSWLAKSGHLIESVFDISKLRTKEIGIEYADMGARYIIFCDGKSSAENPYFEKLPFALNKGEGMMVEIKNLPGGLIFKKGMNLVPFRENVFWLGSSYEWSFADDQPTQEFRNSAESWLQHFLKVPYTILEHFASIRPATLERRPFVGFHPLHPQIGILNGMGTKGCSLAPYFAKQLADKIAGGSNILPLADIARFKRIMGK